MGFISFKNGQKTLEEKIGINLQASATKTLQEIDRLLFNVQQNIQDLGATESLQDVIADDPDGRITSALMHFKKKHEKFSGVFCLNPQGKVIASSSPENIGIDLSSISRLKNAAKSREGYFYDLEYSELADGLAVGFSIPIFASFDQNQIIGYLLAKVDWQKILQIIHISNNQNIFSENLSGLFLINQKGNLLFGPDSFTKNLKGKTRYPPENKIRSLDFQSIRETLKRKNGTLITTDQSGNEILASYASSQNMESLAHLGWEALRVEDTRVAFGPVLILRNQFISIGFLVGIVTMIFSILVSRKIAVPIRKLTNAVDAIARGNLSEKAGRDRFDTKIEISSKDEIGVLAESFIKMIDELRETTVSKDYVNNILNTMSNSLLVVDSNNFIKDVNPAICTLLGYRKEEIIDRPVTIIFPKYLSNLKEQEANNQVKQGAVRNKESIFLSKERKNIPILYSGIIMRDGEGTSQGTVFAAQDITQLKQSEEKLILAKEEAERASGSKSEFLSRMSHELRTPMNAILGFGQLLEYDTKEPLSDSQKERVDEILKAGNHLLKLINEVLDLSRVESGQLELSVEDILVSNAIGDALTLVSPLAAQRNIQITNHLSNHPKLSIKADLTRFKQVLLNLLSNAVKYNQDGGSITLDFQKNGKERIRIDIIDTGEGISEDNLNYLFKPFNRLGNENSAVEGTGIGLTITKHLVEMMGGTISVQSTPGKGSKFSIVFAVGKQLTSAVEDLVISPSKKIPGRTDEQKWTLLYVEDNPANLMLVEQILQTRPDIKLLSAPQAQMGIELANAHKPDLILMDINMPEMDGITAMKKLQNYEETRDIPVIAVSANAMESDIKKALDAGFKAYIIKPFDIPKFYMEIDRFLEPESSTLFDLTKSQ